MNHYISLENDKMDKDIENQIDYYIIVNKMNTLISYFKRLAVILKLNN